MKTRTKILLVLIILAVLGFIFLVPHDDYRRAVADYKKQLLAHGEKLTIAELAPPPFTGPSNAAPAFLALVTNLTVAVPTSPRMNLIAPGVALVDHTNLQPGQLFGYDQNIRQMAQLRAILANASTLDFNLDYSKGFETILPHLSRLKQAENFVTATVLQALGNRDYSEAFLDLNASLDLIRLFDREPFVISSLLRLAMASLALNATWEALEENQWSDAQFAAWQSQWESINLFKPLDASLPLERAGAIQFLDTGRTNRVWLLDWILSVDSSTPSNSISDAGNFVGLARRNLGVFYDRYPRYWLWKSSWSYDEELFDLRITTAATEAVRRVNQTSAFVPAIDEFNRQAASINQSHPDRTNHFVDDFVFDEAERRSYIRIASLENARRLLIAAIALKRFHLQHRAYPAQLADLVPDILREIPADFMDGKPLRYRPNPDGTFLLYSVGFDGHDDGGDPSPDGSLKLNNWTGTRDIVWPRAATPAEAAAYNLPANTATNSPGK